MKNGLLAAISAFRRLSGGTSPAVASFLSIVAVCHMPASFAYLLAISIALGGGYASDGSLRPTVLVSSQLQAQNCPIKVRSCRRNLILT